MNITLVCPVTDCKGLKSRQDLTALLESIDFSQWLEVILCFDGTEWDFTMHFEKLYGDKVHILWTKGKPLDFTQNSNLGIQTAFKNPNCDGIYLVNQDVVLCRNQKALIDLYDEDSIVSPRTEPDDLGIDTDVEPREVNRIAFFCPLIPRKIYDRLGLLDPNMRKTHSDTDYCLRAKLAGFKIIAADNVVIHHYGSHIDTSKPNWESGSGCYNAQDLGFSFSQMCYKWATRAKDDDDLFSKVLTTHKWTDRMKIQGG